MEQGAGFGGAGRGSVKIYRPGRQRAARITYHLILREILEYGGLTTAQIATMLGMSYRGARDLMCVLSDSEGVAVYRDDERKWRIRIESIKTAIKYKIARVLKGHN
jgi:transcription initiation factor IIE alpha subunit